MLKRVKTLDFKQQHYLVPIVKLRLTSVGILLNEQKLMIRLSFESALKLHQDDIKQAPGHGLIELMTDCLVGIKIIIKSLSETNNLLEICQNKVLKNDQYQPFFFLYQSILPMTINALDRNDCYLFVLIPFKKIATKKH